MSPRRGDRVAPPADPTGGWELRFATTEAVRGWETLCQQAAANTLTMWNELRSRPGSPAPTSRHHQLRGSLSTAAHGNETMDQWQYEVTGGGHVWYLVNTSRRTLWIKFAGSGHPKLTE